MNIALRMLHAIRAALDRSLRQAFDAAAQTVDASRSTFFFYLDKHGQNRHGVVSEN